mmetsp:Transcript_7517/g.22565  ORF Transcript_7517/g.22565 Transcript_7517/m.22565 type:complete len:245 (+) Transcript_7517:1054-1788(+)
MQSSLNQRPLLRRSQLLQRKPQLGWASDSTTASTSRPASVRVLPLPCTVSSLNQQPLLWRSQLLQRTPQRLWASVPASASVSRPASFRMPCLASTRSLQGQWPRQLRRHLPPQPWLLSRCLAVHSTVTSRVVCSPTVPCSQVCTPSLQNPTYQQPHLPHLRSQQQPLLLQDLVRATQSTWSSCRRVRTEIVKRFCDTNPRLSQCRAKSCFGHQLPWFCPPCRSLRRPHANRPHSLRQGRGQCTA